MKTLIYLLLISLLMLNGCAFLKELHQEMLDSELTGAPESGWIHTPEGSHYYLIYPNGDIYIR